MVFYHDIFPINIYLNFVRKNSFKLKYNLKVFLIFSVLFLLVSMILTIFDIIVIKKDLNDHRSTEYILILCIAFFFDILKLYYMTIDAYLLIITSGLISLSLTATLSYYIKRLKSVEKKEIRSVADTVIIFMILSMINSTIYHYPTFNDILFIL